MPRIPQSELERIKSEIDLAALVRTKGVDLKPHGSDLIGRCPFHADKTPSLVVTPSKGLWHCLGACQVGGSVIDWVMKTEGVSFRHAAQILSEGKAATLLSSDKIISQSTTRKLACPLTLDADDQDLLNQVTAYYHETLKQSPKALEYLRQRGIDNAEALSTFKLGYADRTLGLRLPEKNREAGANIRERLQKLGVYRQSGHEHLSGSLIIPILDSHGNTLNLYGRKILDNLRPGTAYHLYLPGPHHGLFNPAALSQSDIILCESLIDALSFWVHGFRNVTTAYGVEGFTEEMLSALLAHGVHRVFIAYDRDEAGDRAAVKLGEKLISEGFEALRIQFPHGMDANEYIQKVKPEAKALQVLLHGAEWMGKGKSKTTTLPTGEHIDVETGEVLEVKIQQPPSLAAESSSAMAEVAPVAQAISTPSMSSMPASSLPLPLPFEIKGEDIHVSLGDRAYRIRGLSKNTSFEVLKVNVRIGVGERYHLDTLDFYSAKARETFINHAAVEVEYKADVLKRDLGRLLHLLESLQEEKLAAAMKPKAATFTMTETDRAQALAFLTSPDLTSRIVEDMTTCGYIGEETNKLVGYLAAVSRKLDDPLSVIIQSNSASGKSSLMDAVLAMVPPEDKAEFTALTSQALFYMAEASIKHKLLAIAEDGGLSDAAYALKGLITDKKLRKAAPGKDPQTGKMVTQTYEVEGPSAVLYSSTSSEIEPELKNRCLVLTLNEDKAQTEAILASQRFSQTLEGKKSKKRRDVIRSLHHNAQRLLRGIEVVNRFAINLHFSAEQSRLRRDQMKYLGLMNALALLHQYQRPHKKDSDAGEYIEVTLADVALANRLCAEVLGRTLDELAPQTRRLLNLLTAKVEGLAKEKDLSWSDIRLSRFDIRKSTAWGDTQLKVHLHRLVDLEYLVIHRSSRGLYEYELLYRGEGEDGGKFVLGLIDVEELRNKVEIHAYDVERSGFLEDRSGQNGIRSGSGRPLVGGQSGGGRDAETVTSANKDEVKSEGNVKIPEKAYRENGTASYHTHTVIPSSTP